MDRSIKPHIKGLVAALLVGLLGAQLDALAAGAPSNTKSATEIAREKRLNADRYFKKGEAYQEKKQYQMAEKNYQKAVQIDPHYAEAHSNLGFSYRKQGKFEQAVKAYKRAIDLNPKLAEAHEYLGEAYVEMGQIDLAERQLKVLRELGLEEAEELAEFIRERK